MADLRQIVAPTAIVDAPAHSEKGEDVFVPYPFAAWLRDFWKFEASVAPSFDAVLLYQKLAAWARDASAPLVLDQADHKTLVESAKKPKSRGGYLIPLELLPIEWLRAIIDAPVAESAHAKSGATA